MAAFKLWSVGSRSSSYCACLQNQAVMEPDSKIHEFIFSTRSIATVEAQMLLMVHYSPNTRPLLWCGKRNDLVNWPLMVGFCAYCGKEGGSSLMLTAQYECVWVAMSTCEWLGGDLHARHWTTLNFFLVQYHHSKRYPTLVQATNGYVHPFLKLHKDNKFICKTNNTTKYWGVRKVASVRD